MGSPRRRYRWCDNLSPAPRVHPTCKTPLSHPGKGGHTLDQYGTVLNGPVILPHVYNGKDKTIWMFGFENYHEVAPMATLTSVPSAAERQGDFSGAGLNIYNPFSTQVNPNFNPVQGNISRNTDPTSTNFGLLSLGQTNYPRQVQLGFKFNF